MEAASINQPTRCLVVDDEPHLRRLLSRLMRSEGFLCEEAENGRVAQELLARNPATLVLSDLHMPEVDGIALLKHVRANYPDTAIIMITAVADVETAVACLSEGAMDYLAKPFHPDEVRARVRQALEKRRLILENLDYQERLEDKVAVQAQRIEDIFLASIHSLVDALELRDTYTHGHSIRVSRYSVLIARELGMPDEFIRQVELGGRVHDIGKIGVREQVLHKNSPLTDEEYRHVMEHPVTGWRTLQPLLRDHAIALNVIRSHHERWDGLGLPDKLSGEAIPLEARIAAVADTFDAMTSHRPYRPQLPIDATLEELLRCRETQFDARAVDAFVGLVKRTNLQGEDV
ncbi:MAG TPA: HD domain-containing phosphohydrolase [Gemmatimonadaceae bacterium]|nr:HD domain-containing phosphohydrolase [Gemmatimonadaceae bacterium]